MTALRPFTEGRLNLSQDELNALTVRHVEEREFAINSVLAVINPKARNQPSSTSLEYINFIKTTARSSVAEQVSDRLDETQKNNFYLRYESNTIGHIIASAYSNSSVESYGEFIKPILPMARLALSTAVLEYGDVDLIKIRRNLGYIDSSDGDIVLTPAIGTLIQDFRDKIIT